MPLEPGDLPFVAPDFLEFIGVFITMVISYVILIALGRWWAN